MEGPNVIILNVILLIQVPGHVEILFCIPLPYFKAFRAKYFSFLDYLIPPFCQDRDNSLQACLLAQINDIKRLATKSLVT